MMLRNICRNLIVILLFNNDLVTEILGRFTQIPSSIQIKTFSTYRKNLNFFRCTINVSELSFFI